MERSNLLKLPLAVVRSNKGFAILGRDLLPTQYSTHGLSGTLPTFKGYKGQVKLRPRARPLFCKARVADARSSKSKATGHGQAGSSRVRSARRSYQCIISRVAEKEKWCASDFVPTTKFTSMAK